LVNRAVSLAFFNIALTEHGHAPCRNMAEVLMETDHWSALATANHQLEALKRHL
jgi:hypothetical protein